MSEEKKVYFKKRRKRNPWPSRIVFVLMIMAALWVVYNSGRDYIVSAFTTTVPAEIGVLEDSNQGEGLIFLREKVISAAYSGKLTLLVQNGQRVGKNQGFAELSAFGTTADGKGVDTVISSPAAGMMIYWWDGLENVFSPDILGNSDVEKLFLAAKPQQIGASVQAGQPLAKIIDNLEGIFVVARLSVNYLHVPFQKEEAVKINFDDVRYKATIKDIKTDSEKEYLLLQMSDLPPAFKISRSVNISIVRDVFKGIVLPKTALVPKNSMLGVYVIEANKVHWQAVRILGAVKDKVAVAGIIQSQDVIINPKWVKEGDFAE